MENETIDMLTKLKYEIADARRMVEETVRDEFWALENRLDQEIYDLKRKQEEQGVRT